MKRIIFLFLFSFSIQLCAQSKYSKLDSVTKTNLQAVGDRENFDKIVSHRKEIQLDKRIQNTNWVKLILLENYNTSYSRYETIEIYILANIEKDLSNDTLIYRNGIINYGREYNYYMKTVRFKKKIKYRTLRFKRLRNVKTSGCIKFTRKDLKQRIKNELQSTYKISTLFEFDKIESNYYEKPPKKPFVLIFRRKHTGGF